MFVSLERLGWRLLALSTTFGLLVAACGGGEEGVEVLGTTATVPEPARTEFATTTTKGLAEAVSLNLRFDGENCTYDGPNELKAGPVTLDFHNEIEATDIEVWASANLLRHVGNETIQDMIDYIGPEPTTKHHPSWSQEILGVWHSTPTGESFHWEGELEPGVHTMVCARLNLIPGAWFGSGLNVVE